MAKSDDAASRANPRPAKAKLKAAITKPPKDWQREAAGSHTSADGRFTLEGDGAGRWFVRDAEQADDLGLPRTTGPFPTLAAAKAAAAEQREHGPEASPLAERLEAAASRAPSPRSRPAAGDPSSPPRADSTSEAGSSRSSARSPARPTPAPPAPPSWLETLEAKDRPAARRARELVHDLETLAFDDAEGIVRRDILGGQPEVAKRLLVEAIRRAVAANLAPDALISAARRAGASPDDPVAIVAYAVAQALDVALEVVGSDDRLAKASKRLPGWELVERGPERRRLRVAGADLA
jgi:hypothetical protein